MKSKHEIENIFYEKFLKNKEYIDIFEVEEWIKQYPKEISIAHYDDQPHHSNSIAVFIYIKEFGTSVYLINQNSQPLFFNFFLYSNQAESWFECISKSAKNKTRMTRQIENMKKINKDIKIQNR